MMKRKLTTPLKGIITPMMTPLLPAGELDKTALHKLLEHLLNGGVNAVFVLGTTGEGPSLSYRLKRELITETCQFIKDRIPVLVGITDSSLQESVELANFSEKAGASAVVAAPPFYFGLSQEEVLSYFKRLADEVSLPLYIYNMPAQTKIHIEVETMVRLSQHPNIAGVKDSSGNAIYFNSLLHRLKDNTGFSVFVGPDEMTAQAVLLGGSGGVNSGSNMFPKLFCELYKAAAAKEMEKLQQLQSIVMEISTTIYSQGASSYRFLKGIKTVLSSLQISDNIMMAPLTPTTSQEEAAIKKALIDIQLMIDKALAGN